MNTFGPQSVNFTVTQINQVTDNISVGDIFQQTMVSAVTGGLEEQREIFKQRRNEISDRNLRLTNPSIKETSNSQEENTTKDY